MKDEGRPCIFYALSIFTVVWFAIWAIADFADCNGFVMVSDNFAKDRGAAGVFGLFVAIGSLCISILGVVNAVLFYRR